MKAEETKALLHRWYGEMWSQGKAELIPELAGPTYTRHEMSGTRTVTADEYRDQTAAFMNQITVCDLEYSLIAEGDKVCAIGSWRLVGLPDDTSGEGKQWDWVQLFRAEHGKLVETWLSGIAMESSWGPATWASLEKTICEA